MHLVYLDDSGSDNPSPVVVVGAIAVSDAVFWKLDFRCGSIVESLVPEDKRDDFEEFKAADLFGGYGSFHGVSPEERHKVIRALLGSLPRFNVRFFYAAVDKAALKRSAFASSQAIDVAFRICACGVSDWVSRPVLGENGEVVSNPNQFMLIADDTDDKTLKQMLRSSFRVLRPKKHQDMELADSRMWLCHDEMYFGDSKSSIGIQIADLCSHIMLRRLRDGIQDEFFQALSPYAQSARPSPYWEQCSSLMMVHEEEDHYQQTLLSLAALGLQETTPASSSDEKAPDEGQS